jgi:hypothetical protein
MLKSAPSRSLICCVVYLGIVVLIATAASSKGMCGDGDFRPPCSMFAFGVALYGGLAIGAMMTLVVLVGIVIRRRVSPLLKTSAILYASALLSFVLPVRAAGNKFAGAIVVMMALPISLVLLSAALICIVLWAGRAWAQSPGDTMLSGSQASTSN